MGAHKAVARFKIAMLAITKLNQCLAFTTYNRSLLAATKSLTNHYGIDNLILGPRLYQKLLGCQDIDLSLCQGRGN